MFVKKIIAQSRALLEALFVLQCGLVIDNQRPGQHSQFLQCFYHKTRSGEIIFSIIAHNRRQWVTKFRKKMMKLHVQRCNQRNGQWKCSQMCSCIRLACRTNRASSTLPILDEMFWWTGGGSLKGWMVNPSKKHHGGRRHHLNLPHHQLQGGAPAHLAVAWRCVEWKT